MCACVRVCRCPPGVAHGVAHGIPHAPLHQLAVGDVGVVEQVQAVHRERLARLQQAGPLGRLARGVVDLASSEGELRGGRGLRQGARQGGPPAASPCAARSRRTCTLGGERITLPHGTRHSSQAPTYTPPRALYRPPAGHTRLQAPRPFPFPLGARPPLLHSRAHRLPRRAAGIQLLLMHQLQHACGGVQAHGGVVAGRLAVAPAHAGERAHTDTCVRAGGQAGGPTCAAGRQSTRPTWQRMACEQSLGSLEKPELCLGQWQR